MASLAMAPPQDNTPVPTPVSGLSSSDVKSVSAGHYHSLALKNDGTVWAWGDNQHGELGNGTTTTTGCQCIDAPVQVPNLSGVSAISAGYGHSLALKKATLRRHHHRKTITSVLAWGDNVQGQLGNGSSSTTDHSDLPVKVSNLSGVTAIARGSTAFHSLALKRDGSAWAWGRNDLGQLGNGTINTTGCTCIAVPGQVSNLSGATSISASEFHSLAN
jgi:alpha-tubulin suppressor-like RCC1 family protein